MLGQNTQLDGAFGRTQTRVADRARAFAFTVSDDMS